MAMYMSEEQTAEELARLLGEQHCATCRFFGGSESINNYTLSSALYEEAACRRYAPGGGGFQQVRWVDGCGDYVRDTRDLKRALSSLVQHNETYPEHAESEPGRSRTKRWLTVLTDCDNARTVQSVQQEWG